MPLIGRFDPFQGARLEVIDPEGRLVNPDLEPPLPDESLKRMYALMVATRWGDQKALNLQRQGRLGTFASSRGHEACQVGSAFPLRPEDWVFPYFRDFGLYQTLGYPLADFYHYWMGHEAGLRTPEGLNLFPFAIPVGSQILHAAGAGLAAKIQGKPVAVLATFGDGATSEGDFHEGLNFAGVFRTPNVFVCYNNQWAISTPRRRQTASETIAQKAAAYGFSGLAVDGNDVLAVFAAAAEALDRARTGGGPTLIEAVTYRLGDHTTADDARKYRPEAEVKDWEARDPIRRFQAYLKHKGLWDEAFENDVRDKAAAAIDKAVAEAEARPAATPEDVFVHTYKDMTPRLRAQLAELRTAREEPGR
ncbi:MAG: pyruvate dehydrogenase (acetyl-transferring) E1 component subunit alpha [Candidatus Aminicenantes bacterium]|nr:pyruvate dehydrogenase (acetyl-transferring) E1 component subunit alpha [Candidatus Aminicenantes bacterium]